MGTSRFLHVGSICLAVLVLNSCGGRDVDGPPIGASVRVISGAGVTDTIDAELQPLVVEVRRLGGELAANTVVHFEAQTISDPPHPFQNFAVNVCSVPTCSLLSLGFVNATTDASGRASVGVRLGPRTGTWTVTITVADFNLTETASYTINAGAPAAVHAPIADTALDIGEKVTMHGRVVDRYDNARTESTTLTAGSGDAITVDAALSTATARDMGTQFVFTRYNSLYDSTRIRVLPSGRLLVWSALEKVVRLVDINGRNERTIASNVWSALGAHPQFDATRQQVTLENASDPAGTNGNPDVITVIDTTGTPRRGLGTELGFDGIMATRQTADGTLFVVARRASDASHPDWNLWRVGIDNSVTFLAYLPDTGPYNGGADISHDGSKVVFAANAAVSPPQLYVMDVASGTTTLIDNGFSPRWSAQGDRIAYLTAIDGSGTAMVANVDGTGRRSLGTPTFSQSGFAWSPDGTYVAGRNSEGNSLHIIRVADGAHVLAFFRAGTGFHDYWQPDWR